MNYLYWLFLLSSPLLMGMDFHSVYVSNTEIDYKADTKVLEISIKIFSDDLQKAISLERGMDVEIATEREHAQATEFIIAYLNKHFKMEVNGKATSFEYVNRVLDKKELFALLILVKVPKVKSLKSLKLFNDILIDTHSQQQNFINFRDAKGTYQKYITKKNSTTVVLK